MLKLRAICEDDLYKRFEGELMGPADLEGVMSASPNKMIHSDAGSHVRYYIKLHEKVPVMNPVTCGSEFGCAAHVLGCKRMDLQGLFDFTRAFDNSDGMLKYVSECAEPLFNGAGLIAYIKSVSFYDRIVDWLTECVHKVLADDDVVFDIVLGNGDIRLIGGFFVEFEDTEYDEELLQKEFDAYFLRAYSAGTLRDVFYVINLLLEFSYDDDAIKDYLCEMYTIKHVGVVPINMRPSMQSRRHPMSQLYTQLFHANTTVTYFHETSGAEFRERYRQIVKLVEALVVKNDLLNDDIKMLEPVINRIKSKETGVIRSAMLKKRLDYSGRGPVIVDPFMPVDCVGIPASMLVKMLRPYLTKECNMQIARVYQDIGNPDFEPVAVKELERSGVFDSVPILLGRNPTLHKFGILGFKIKPVSGRAIRVSPPVCPAYNMDFDGDTAHTEAIITPKAAREVFKLMLSSHNVILPKTGNSTLCPEKDAVYGLYTCTRDDYKDSKFVGTYKDANSLLEALYVQDVYVWDRVTCGEYGTKQAGRIAFESCFPKKYVSMLPNEPVTQDVIKKCVEMILELPKDDFSAIINKLVSLGIKMSYLYSKSVSMLQSLNSNDEFDKAIDEFNQAMDEVYELSDLGFYDSDGFGLELSERVQKIDEVYKNNIYDKIPDNMFLDMAKSGTRGNKSNLIQMFGSKGRIAKSESEAFNVYIKRSMRDQLTPMDEAISAHGARKGQIAKSIKTADTGYFGRKLNHVCATIVVTTNDCGTKRGRVVHYDAIKSRLVRATMTSDDISKLDGEAEKIYERFISGRYDVKAGAIISKSRAKELALRHIDVEIRTPVLCEDPCCQRCYGIDPETGRLPAIGKPVGLIAAMSVSEPATQLTMKEFQKGGVAGASSPFDRMNSILCGTDLRTNAATGKYFNYDPVAWTDGILRAQSVNKYTLLLSIEGPGGYFSKSNRRVTSEVQYKIGHEVKKGDTLRIIPGDNYMPEVVQYSGIEAAWESLINTLYFLCKSQVDLLPIHLEIIALQLTSYTPLTSNSKFLKVGKSYTRRLLIDIGEWPVRGLYHVDIMGMNKALSDNPNFMEAFIMEDQRSVIANAVANCLFDINTSPILQLALGHRVKVGTGYTDTYLEDI